MGKEMKVTAEKYTLKGLNLKERLMVFSKSAFWGQIVGVWKCIHLPKWDFAQYWINKNENKDFKRKLAETSKAHCEFQK